MFFHLFGGKNLNIIREDRAKREAPLGPCARPVPWPHEGLPLLPVVENEFYGYKIIICMLWLVKQSTLTWLLLTFMFPRTLFKLQSAMSSPDLTRHSPAQVSRGSFLILVKFAILQNVCTSFLLSALCSDHPAARPPAGGGKYCWTGIQLLTKYFQNTKMHFVSVRQNL